MSEDHANGHRERLRARFLNAGVDVFADYEILELLLMQSITRKDVKPLAKDLIKTFGTLAKTLDADYKDLLDCKGIGERTAFSLKLAAGVNQSYSKKQVKETINLGSSFELIDYLYTKLSSLTHEEFHAIYLDSKNNLIKDECIFRGSVNSSAVYPREVLKQAIKHGAGSLVICHNHPSGDPTPSLDDDLVTTEMQAAARTLHIKLIDHVIIGKGEHYSYADSGKLVS
ncbi:MAG: DNA repair protein RadC [Alphaproteobacteria bacterium]|jgi:DNA repair protein RadC